MTKLAILVLLGVSGAAMLPTQYSLNLPELDEFGLPAPPEDPFGTPWEDLRWCTPGLKNNKACAKFYYA